jgi:hypothetical protein
MTLRNLIYNYKLCVCVSVRPTVNDEWWWMTNDLFLDDFRHIQWWMMRTGLRGASPLADSFLKTNRCVASCCVIPEDASFNCWIDECKSLCRESTNPLNLENQYCNHQIRIKIWSKQILRRIPGHFRPNLGSSFVLNSLASSEDDEPEFKIWSQGWNCKKLLEIYYLRLLEMRCNSKQSWGENLKFPWFFSEGYLRLVESKLREEAWGKWRKGVKTKVVKQDVFCCNTLDFKMWLKDALMENRSFGTCSFRNEKLVMRKLMQKTWELFCTVAQ